MFSIAIYSLFLAPVLNLVLPSGLFFGLFFAYWEIRQRRISDNPMHPDTDPTPNATFEPQCGLGVHFDRFIQRYRA
jgi:hypothetical protein